MLIHPASQHHIQFSSLIFIVKKFGTCLQLLVSSLVVVFLYFSWHDKMFEIVGYKGASIKANSCFIHFARNACVMHVVFLLQI